MNHRLTPEIKKLIDKYIKLDNRIKRTYSLAKYQYIQKVDAACMCLDISMLIETSREITQAFLWDRIPRRYSQPFVESIKLYEGMRANLKKVYRYHCIEEDKCLESLT